MVMETHVHLTTHKNMPNSNTAITCVRYTVSNACGHGEVEVLKAKLSAVVRSLRFALKSAS